MYGVVSGIGTAFSSLAGSGDHDAKVRALINICHALRPQFRCIPHHGFRVFSHPKVCSVVSVCGTRAGHPSESIQALETKEKSPVIVTLLTSVTVSTVVCAQIQQLSSKQ